MTHPFRILCLSGGGARGIFQARLLEMLEENHTERLFEAFDLIAATSTGALVGLAVAAGHPMSSIVNMYVKHATEIFKPRCTIALRKGGRYNQTTLRNLLEAQFGSQRLSELKTSVLIPASVVNTFEGRFFTTNDKTITVVEAALATSAAPTYFPPVVPQEHDRGYMDGGLWANDPSYLAFHYAVSSLGIPKESIRLVSVGTGRVQYGTTPEAIRNLRILSFSTLRFLRDFTSNLQDWFSQRLCEETLSPTRFLRINPYLTRWISLDDAHSALSFLPGLAESEYERHSTNIAHIISTEHLTNNEQVLPQISPALRRCLADAGVTRFMPARKYYAQYRDGRESIGSYISLAQSSLTMVSISLATGMDLEKVVNTFRALLNRAYPVKTIISLLDPELPYLMAFTAPIMDKTPEDLAKSITETITELGKLWASLPNERKTYLELWCHSTLPQASAIMIDEQAGTGLIQLETKAYKARRIDSFAFEIRAGTEFYSMLQSSYAELIKDGRQLLPR
jgi:predicted acylesterase/phospholipase RssA